MLCTKPRFKLMYLRLIWKIWFDLTMHWFTMIWKILYPIFVKAECVRYNTRTMSWRNLSQNFCLFFILCDKSSLLISQGGVSTKVDILLDNYVARSCVLFCNPCLLQKEIRLNVVSRSCLQQQKYCAKHQDDGLWRKTNCPALRAPGPVLGSGGKVLQTVPPDHGSLAAPKSVQREVL